MQIRRQKNKTSLAKKKFRLNSTTKLEMKFSDLIKKKRKPK